jgi:hypothetical protein
LTKPSAFVKKQDEDPRKSAPGIFSLYIKNFVTALVSSYIMFMYGSIARGEFNTGRLFSVYQAQCGKYGCEI